MKRMSSGTLIAVAFAACIAMGVLIVGLYKATEHSLPPVAATFQALDSRPAGATVHELEFQDVHADPFLEDHLTTAVDRGASEEHTRLRVEQMRATLRQLTGSEEDRLYVLWQDHVVRVTFSGFAD